MKRNGVRIVYFDRDNAILEHDGFREIVSLKDLAYRPKWYDRVNWLKLFTHGTCLLWCATWLVIGWFAGSWIIRALDRLLLHR